MALMQNHLYFLGIKAIVKAKEYLKIVKFPPIFYLFPYLKVLMLLWVHLMIDHNMCRILNAEKVIFQPWHTLIEICSRCLSFRYCMQTFDSLGLAANEAHEFAMLLNVTLHKIDINIGLLFIWGAFNNIENGKMMNFMTSRLNDII